MHQKLSWFKIVVLIVLFLAPSSLALAEGTPKLVLPESRFEFLPVLDGEEVVHDYVVRNTGTAMLHITDIKAG